MTADGAGDLHRELDAAAAEIRRELEDGRALLGVRIENEVRRNDERHATLLVTLDRRFAEAHALIAAAESRSQADAGHLRELHEERFTGIGRQFAERDVRTEQAAKAGKEALEAALLSAKELVAQQNEANRAAAAKTEQSFTKQIDAQAARIDELKERIDRGEGSASGAAGQRGETSAGSRDALAAEQAKIQAQQARMQMYALVIAAAVLALGVYAAFHH